MILRSWSKAWLGHRDMLPQGDSGGAYFLLRGISKGLGGSFRLPLSRPQLVASWHASGGTRSTADTYPGKYIPACRE